MVQLKINAKRLQQAIEKLPGDLFQQLRQGFKDSTDIIERKIQGRLRGRPGLRRRSGTLARSINRRVEGTKLSDLRFKIGTNVKYAKIQEFGGTVRPKPGHKFLTIPTSENRTRAGVARKRAREFRKLFFAHSKRGALLAFDGSRRPAVPVFILKKSVKIPPRPFLLNSFQKSRNPVVSRLNRAVNTALKRGGLLGR